MQRSEGKERSLHLPESQDERKGVLLRRSDCERYRERKESTLLDPKEPKGLRHLFQRMQVLDAGCGSDTKGDYRLDIVRTEATNIIADVHRLPFKDGSVWLVRSSHCLEHVDKPLQVVGEFVRVAQRYVCVTVPYTLDLDETEHIYSWTKASLTHFLNRFPFVDIAVTGNNRFSDGSFWGRSGQIVKMIYKGVAVMLNIPMEYNATCTLCKSLEDQLDMIREP